jgi:phospholipid/cholesterol/gamma-HCH transport system substrate-binding protein
MRQTRGAMVRMIVFFVTSLLVGYGTWNMLSGGSTGPTQSFSAVFTDVSGLSTGNEARIAGVPIGRVEDITLDGSGHAVVRFGIDRSVVLTSTSRVAVRYKDLTGGRYISLFQPASDALGTPLQPGASIPLSRTQPALDLDQLFGSFQPLLQGLSPDQVNRLSTAFIQVLQGEGSTMLALLQDVATFTASLADRDDLIGQVLDNLSAGIATIDDGSNTLRDALQRTQSLVSSLNSDRRTLATGLRDVDSLAVQATDLLSALRPPLMATATQVDRLASVLNKPANAKAIDEELSVLPGAYLRMSGAGSYGTFYNFYLCGLGLELDGVKIPVQELDVARCR